ncbi:hypothetical protein Acr_08g0009710 [Actinidia rufa]|uniref:Uncharacterized protein n=1 Tax=Actinidia rufa TaxID=165716 RepID=A0A7J0F1K8_9ERIC|nr:hypothetical protein Acr_08g0009710 [Actinidia rufa]
MLRMKEGAVFVEEAEDREKQLTEAVKEDCREVSDGGSLLLHCQEWGLYELSHELICSSLWPINSKGCQREKKRCREMQIGRTTYICVSCVWLIWLDVTGDWSLGTTIGIKAKFESPESHRSDFGGERKPISNSDQIQSAQKWHLSIPPDSSCRDEAPAPNRVKIGRRTSTHAPPEKCLILTEEPFLSFLGIPDSSARLRPVETKDEGHGRRCTRKQIRQIRQCIGHEHDETSAHGLWTKLKEMYWEKTSQNKALMRRLVLKLQRRNTVEELTSEFQRRDKKNCPRNKAQDQSSEAATTVMMAVNESDVLLAASADEESDWISDPGIAYHLCRDREVFSTHVACEGLVRMANDAIVGKGQSRSNEVLKLVEEHSEFSRETGEAAGEGRLKGYTDWRKVSRQEELLSDISPVKFVQTRVVQPVQDIHKRSSEEGDKEELYSYRRDDAESNLFRSRLVAVVFPVVCTRGRFW